MRRILLMIPTVIIVSVISFVIIQAPPGGYVSACVAQLRISGEYIDQEAIGALKARYGVDQSIYIQYFKWLRNILRVTWACQCTEIGL